MGSSIAVKADIEKLGITRNDIRSGLSPLILLNITTRRSKALIPFDPDYGFCQWRLAPQFAMSHMGKKSSTDFRRGANRNIRLYQTSHFIRCQPDRPCGKRHSTNFSRAKRGQPAALTICHPGLSHTRVDWLNLREIGVWVRGKGIFDNDAACDWVYDLEEAEEDDFLDRTMNAAISGEMVRYPTYAEHSALAAAEIIAALLGRPCGGLTETAEEWLTKNPQAPAPKLVEKALAAIEKVTTDSLLAKTSWSEGGMKAAWEACIEDLKARLT